MTPFATQEASQRGGDPVEAFAFSVGATVYRYTSGDAPFQVPGDSLGAANYVPASIRADEGVTFDKEDASGQLKIVVERLNPVAVLFMSENPPDPVFVRRYKMHRGDTDAAMPFTGLVASASFTDSECVLTCLPLSSVFQRRVPTLYYQRRCNWPLYSPGCTVAKASFEVSAASPSQSGRVLSDAAFGAKADGWFDNGFVTRTSDGSRRRIVSHTGNDLTLQSPFIGTIGAVLAYAGCDKTEDTCRLKFVNIEHHLGMPRIPSKNPHSKGVE